MVSAAFKRQPLPSLLSLSFLYGFTLKRSVCCIGEEAEADAVPVLLLADAPVLPASHLLLPHHLLHHLHHHRPTLTSQSRCQYNANAGFYKQDLRRIKNLIFPKMPFLPKAESTKTMDNIY